MVTSSPIFWISVVLILSPIWATAIKVYALLPLRAYRRQLLELQRTHRLSRPEDMTSEAVSFVGDILNGLVAEGFEVVLNDFLGKAATDTVVNTIFMVNRESRETATISVVRHKLVRSLSIAIQTEFSNGNRMTSGFTQAIGTTPKDFSNDTLTISWCKDPHAIVEFHRRREALEGKPVPIRVIPAPGEERFYVERQWERECDHYVRCGYWYKDVQANALRLTLWGAYLFTWKLCPPFKQMRIRRRETIARKVWNDLGMPRWIAENQAVVAEPVALDSVTAKPISTHKETGPIAARTFDYAAILGAGEVREHFANDTLDIRVGTANLTQTLANMWGVILSTLLEVGALCLVVIYYWSFRQRISRLPPRIQAHIHSNFPLWTCTWLLLFIWFNSLNLYRRLSRAGKTIRLSISQRGLSYENCLTRPSTGEILREDVYLIHIIRVPRVFRRAWHRLIIRTVQGRGIVLVTDPNKMTLSKIQESIAKAMGIAITSQSADTNEPATTALKA